MAVTETRVLPAEYIEALGKTYADQLTKAVGTTGAVDVSKLYGQQFVAGPSALQTQAEQLAGGLGSYAPYLQAAQAATGPTAYQAYMSPYQQDVIGTTLKEYDIQAQKGLGSIAQQAIQAGAFGGGREGVQRAEYQTASDRNRAALQAQLLQQGFTQAQQLAQQAQAQRAGIGAQQMGLAGQQLGVGQAQLGAQLGLAGQQLGLGQFQAGLAGQAPALAGQEISALTTLGGLQQSQQQAQLAAQQQLAQAQLQQPLQATQALGSGITSLIAGYPGATTTTMAPSPSPLQTALGAGATLAGVYRVFS